MASPAPGQNRFDEVAIGIALLVAVQQFFFEHEWRRTRTHGRSETTMKLAALKDIPDEIGAPFASAVFLSGQNAQQNTRSIIPYGLSLLSFHIPTR